MSDATHLANISQKGVIKNNKEVFLVKDYKSSNSKELKQIKKMPDILKVSELSEIFECSEYFVRKLIREKKIQAVRFGHGYRITKKSVLKYLEGVAA